MFHSESVFVRKYRSSVCLQLMQQIHDRGIAT